MKKLIVFFAIITTSFLPAFAQQIDFAYGAHYMDGKIKPVYGMSIKDIYKHVGFYAGRYSPKLKQLRDTVFTHTPGYHDAHDSIVYNIDYLPYGFAGGLTYSFDCRITAYAGIGFAVYRSKHGVYNNIYMPTSSGSYSTLYASEHSESLREIKQTLCFEIGADYDILPNQNWAFGPRINYNTDMKFSGQVFVGYFVNRQ